MKMSKVDDILQNLMSKETIFSEVSSSSKIKAHYASEAKKVVEKVSQPTSKNCLLDHFKMHFNKQS